MTHRCVLVLGICAVMMVLAQPSCASDTHRWPTISPFKTIVALDDHTAKSARVVLPTNEKDTAYVLECHINAYEYEDGEFDYSGDFECRLSLGGSTAYGTLLREPGHVERDWQSRGRFLLEELTGKCADYPEYGRSRHFRLRGFMLTLNILTFEVAAGSALSNVPWNRERLDRVVLEVVVTPDESAVTDTAAEVDYMPPPFANESDPSNMKRQCDDVVRRAEGVQRE